MGLAPNSQLSEFTLEQCIPEAEGVKIILDQGATSSCVAHAFIGGIHLMENRAGLPFQNASRLFAYYNSRREHSLSGLVTDSGTYLSTCAAGLYKFGTPDEAIWPFSEWTLTVNKRPSYGAISYAHPRASGKYVEILETGDDRINAIKSAIAAGFPVAFGTNVTIPFTNSIGVTEFMRPTVTDSIAGGHALLAIGWKTDTRGIWFRILNSWGPRWRDGGLCWFHEDYMAKDPTNDLHVVYGWNRITEHLTGPGPV